MPPIIPVGTGPPPTSHIARNIEAVPRRKADNAVGDGQRGRGPDRGDVVDDQDRVPEAEGIEDRRVRLAMPRAAGGLRRIQRARLAPVVPLAGRRRGGVGPGIRREPQARRSGSRPAEARCCT